MASLAETLIDEEEGPPSSHVYLVNNVMHIARGCVVDPKLPSDGLCQAALEAQDAWDMERAKQLAWMIPGFQSCNEVRQAVLTSMTYQLGSLKGWVNLRRALASGDYEGAAREMLESQWAKETPNRAKRQALMMRLGIWIEHGSDFGD